MSELAFIEAIKKLQPTLPQGCIGIGDDAALIESGSEGGWLIATDMLLDRRHFDVALHHLKDIGHKALAVNLSDIAAMGGWPHYALVSLAVPEGFGLERSTQLWEGLQNLAAEFEVAIIGGDTNAWADGLVINVCVLGRPHSTGSILRSGANAGDNIFVTGSLGGSLKTFYHLQFQPKLREARQLLEHVRPTAMIDISDGLSTDLNHICAASAVGADLNASAIPISSRVPLNLPNEIRLERALSDGEDFELLFTLPPSQENLLHPLSFTCHKIGTIIKEPGIRLDGNLQSSHGFEHTF